MSSTSIATPQRRRRENLVRIAILAACLTLPMAVYDVYLGFSNGVSTRTIYFLLAAVVLTLLFTTSIAIIRSRHAEKPTFGTWHLLTLLSISFLLSSALQSNVGADMGVALLVISLVVSIQTLPPEQVFRGAILGAGASLVASLLVFYSPLPQEIDPRIDSVTIWIARGATLAVLFITFLQFRSLNLTNKFLITFLGVVVSISMTFNVVSSSINTIELTDQVGQQLQLLAESRSNQLSGYISNQVDLLQTLALDENLRQNIRVANAIKLDLASITKLDEQWRQAVAGNPDDAFVQIYTTNSLSFDLRAFQELHLDHIEIFVTDKRGALIAASQLTSDYYQADEDWWQATYNTGGGGIYISLPEFDESVGEYSILIGVPVYNTRAELLGILRSTLSLQHILGILNQPIGETGTSGLLFPVNTYIDTQTEEYRAIPPEDMAALQESINQPYITTIYRGKESIFTQASVKSQGETSILDDLGWSVFIAQHTTEALEPARQQSRVTGLAATLLAGIAALFSFLVARSLAQPIISLTDTAAQIGSGNLSTRANIESQDEIGQLADTFNNMAAQLQGSLSNLEQRVAERTTELEESTSHLQKRAEQFQAIAQLARTISTIQDLDTLFNQITQQVSKQFGFYHTGLFLVDESGKYAVLNAANSEGGQRMLARKHRLAVGQTGIVGYVTSSGNPRIALDTGTDAVYFNNPDLPDTRSEMALPLRVGHKIIGALDVQSTEPNAFSEDDIEVLSILADEVSIAIENARLLAESQRVLADAQSAYGEFTKDAWKQITGRRKSIGYEITGTTIRPLEKPISSIGIHKDIQEGAITLGKKAETLAIPIKLRDEVIGAINISLPGNRQLDLDELDITQALAERVGIAIESATLLEESRRRAARESTISAISAKVSATAEIERIMQVAVGELRQALGAAEVSLQITPEE